MINLRAGNDYFFYVNISDHEDRNTVISFTYDINGNIKITRNLAKAISLKSGFYKNETEIDFNAQKGFNDWYKWSLNKNKIKNIIVEIEKEAMIEILPFKKVHFVNYHVFKDENKKCILETLLLKSEK